MIKSTATSILPTLRRGNTGNDVKYLQEILTQLGYSVGVDGIFGPRTEAAVKQFQKDNGLTADGIVGARTWSALQYQLHD